MYKKTHAPFKQLKCLAIPTTIREKVKSFINFHTQLFSELLKISAYQPVRKMR